MSEGQSLRHVPRTVPRARLVEPGGEEPFDLPAASWLFQTTGDRVSLHDKQGRDGTDLEAREQIRALLLGDVHDLERPVVPAALQHLREKALDAAALPGHGGVEEDKSRLVLL